MFPSLILLLVLALPGCGWIGDPGHAKVGRASIAIKELRGLSLKTNDEFGRPAILACGRDSLYVAWAWSPGYDLLQRRTGARDTLFLGLTRDGTRWDRRAVLAVGRHREARLFRSSRAVYALLGSRLLRIHDDLSNTLVANLDYPASCAKLEVDVALQEPDSLTAAYNIVTQAPDGRAVESILFARWYGDSLPSGFEMVSQVPWSGKATPTAALSYVDGAPRIVVNQAVGRALAGVNVPSGGRPAGLPVVVEYRRTANGSWRARPLTTGIPEFWTGAAAADGTELAVLLQSDDRLACLSCTTDGRARLAGLRAPKPMTDPGISQAWLASDSGGGPFAIAAWKGMQDLSTPSLARLRLPLPLMVLLGLERTEDVFFAGIDLRTAVAGETQCVGDGTPWHPRESTMGMALAAAPGGGALAVVTSDPGVGNRSMSYRLHVYRLLRRP